MSKSVAKNILAKGSLEIFNTLLPFILTPYVYRVVGRDWIGNIEYTNTLLSYFSIMGMLGIYNYGLRSLSSNRNNLVLVRDTFKNLFTIGLVSNLTFFLLYVLFIHYCITDEAVKIIGYIFSANLFAQALNIEWVNEAFEEFQFITTKTILIRLLSVIAIFSFVRSSRDAIIYVAILSGITLIDYLVSFVYAIKRLNIPAYELFSGLHWKDFIPALLIILVLRNTGILYTIVDRTMLGHYTGTANVALFSIGQRVVEIVKALVLSVVFATLPRLALYLKEDRELYLQGLRKIIRLMIALLMPIGIGLFLLSEEVILIMGGEQYIGAVASMRIFSLRLICLGIESIIYNQILFLHGKEKVILKYNLLCGLLNVGLNFIFLSVLDPFIAILTTWICEIIFQLSCLLYIKNKLRINIGLLTKYNLRYLSLSLLFIPIVIGFKLLPISQVLHTVLSIFSCAIFYFSILYYRKDESLMEIMARCRTNINSYLK